MSTLAADEIATATPRLVRSARVLRVPIVTILLAAIVASFVDVGASYALGRWSEPPIRERLLHFYTYRGRCDFTTLGGVECELATEDMTVLDLAPAVLLGGLKWGLAIALPLSLAASLGLLRVRLGSAK